MMAFSDKLSITFHYIIHEVSIEFRLLSLGGIFLWNTFPLNETYWNLHVLFVCQQSWKEYLLFNCEYPNLMNIILYSWQKPPA